MFVITYIIIFISLVGDNIWLKITDYKNFTPRSDCLYGDEVSHKLVDMSNFTVYLGIASYGYEAVGS